MTLFRFRLPHTAVQPASPLPPTPPLLSSVPRITPSPLAAPHLC